VVLASGGLGLVYLTASEHRLSKHEIDDLHPELIPALVGHPGIGFVLVRTGEDDGVVLGPDGSRTLGDGSVSGEDPLGTFGENAVHHLLRTHGFSHCPDLLVNCMYDPDANEIAPFEEFMGSHGGIGGWQSHPFALVPASWTGPVEPIVGAGAMHQALRGWLGETGLEVRPHADAASG
jgi:hypothetical protein